jgi:hypothetical protein
MSTEQALQAQAEHQDTLLAKSNVVGVAIGFKESKGETQGELSVVVLVEQKKPLAALSAQDVVPPEIDGMRTDVYEVGTLRAQQTPRDRFRPIIPNGASVGHYKVTAGTLGTIVKDKATGERFILSNNHVLANSNDALIGDAILQPGAIDGGQNPGDVIAQLERFVRLRYIDDPVEETPPTPPTPDPGTPPNPNPNPTPVPSGGCDVVAVVAAFANFLATILGSDKRVAVSSRAMMAAASAVSTPAMPIRNAFPQTVAIAAAGPTVPENPVDCALARPLDPNMFSDDIPGIGIVNETKLATLGMRVRKAGRTTGYTEGNITLLNATVNVGYSTVKGPRTARFTGQIITEPMSQGGDSGSLIVDATENKAVGLLFAGSNLATIFTPIDAVLIALNITL